MSAALAIENTPMNWKEFLNKIRLYKATCVAGQVNLRANSLITLLYAGAFDGMLGIERPDLPAYQLFGNEMLHALGSKAGIPKAKKGDIIGLDQVQTTLDLHIWRSSINPTYKFNIVEEFDRFLSGLGFRKEDSTSPYAYRRAGSELAPEAFIFKDIKSLYQNEAYSHFFTTKKAHIGIFGVVMDFKVRTTKSGTEMGTFKLFTGNDTTENIYVWPKWRKDQDGTSKKEEFISRSVQSSLSGNKPGLAFVKPSYWNDSKQLTLLKWHPSNENLRSKT
ncbi:hypothetical protein UFOVP244_40 [uncultured Caudovirales phage]|uniref:Uncharacterized protein n=1 Tax=uncultured Caudovirales phage TaxID=2100421 RepID=A0A6J7X0P8_9CAUD|nr:hypothetical protein UFOVP244_40 [uncultured Caudovirales phage]